MRSLLKGLLMMSSLSAIMASFALVYAVAVVKHHLRDSFTTDAMYVAHLAQMICLASLLALFLLVIVGICLWKRLPEVVGPAVIEIGTILLMCLIMMVAVLSAPSKVATLLLGEVFGEEMYTSDSGSLMIIDGIVTAAHLGLPMRWHMMLPLEVAAVMLYGSLVFIKGSDEPMENALFNMIFLTSLVVATGVGKRIFETGERATFVKVIQEKQLRCEAEFQLSQAELQEGGDAHGAPSEAASQLRPRSHADSSALQSSLSGQIFRGLGKDDVDPEVQLARVAEMGRTEHWCIDRSEVVVAHDMVLGSGGFGVVVEGEFCGMPVAVKCPREELSTASLSKLRGLANELRVLRHLRHPNIVHTYGAIIGPEQPRIALVLELVDGVTITEFLRGSPGAGTEGITLSARFQIIFGVCLALLYMHTRKPHVVHGDIKTTNIMVAVSGQKVAPKLLDFGLARIITRSVCPLGGSHAWMAPEVLLQTKTPLCSADIYSFGCLIAYVATGTPPPMTGWDKRRIKRAFSLGTAPLPSWPQGCALEAPCKDLSDSCLGDSEAQRPSISKVHASLRGTQRALARQGQLPWALASLARRDGHSADAGPSPPARQSASDPSAQLSQNDAAAGAPPLSPPTTAPASARVAEEVDSGEADAADGCRQEVSEQGQHPTLTVHPGKIPTAPEAMKTSLLDLVTQWNFEVPEGSCCTLHAGARQVRRVSDEILEMSCADRGISEMAQCSQCGMLGVPNVHECHVCRVLANPRRTEASAVRGPLMQL